jgi:hypothetical protein
VFCASLRSAQNNLLRIRFIVRAKARTYLRSCKKQEADSSASLRNDKQKADNNRARTKWQLCGGVVEQARFDVADLLIGASY